MVIPFQNGVERIERIARRRRRPARACGGVAYIAATIAEPGVIAHTGTMARLRFGAGAAERSNRARRGVRRRACLSAGIDAEVVADIRRALWEKFVFLRAVSGVTASTRQPLGVIRSRSGPARDAFEAAMREAWTVGPRARSASLADDFVAQQMTFAR